MTLSVVTVRLGVLFGLLAVGSLAHAGEIDCGPLENAYGPYDYTNADHRQRYMPIVVGAHFNRDVETLKRGQSSVNAMDDIHYTLRAFPNHHRALDAAARYYLQGGKQGNFYSAECYFDRAMRFKPDDGYVYLLYGTYLHRKKDFAGAAEQYQRSLVYMPDSADTHYNLGLLYADTAKWDQAKTEALSAYRLGYPLPGLKRRLQRQGVWGEAEDRALAAAAAKQ